MNECMGSSRQVAFLVVAFCCAGCNVICEAGETQICYCPGGETGSQTCNSRGTAWGPCSCEEADTSTDTIVDTGVDTTYDSIVPEPECATDEHCDDGDPCTNDRCNEYGFCSNTMIDEDEDGYFVATVDGTDCGGADCDDTREDVYPGHPEESCDDGVDQDCRGANLRIDPAVGVTEIASFSGSFVRMLWTGSTFAVAMEGGELVRVEGNGSTVGSGSSIGFFPEGFVWTGSEFGAAGWETGSVEEVIFARHDAEGVRIGSMIPLTSGATVAGGEGHTGLAWTGSEFTVVTHYEGGSGIVQHYFRLDGEGAILSEHTWSVPGSEVHGTRAFWTGSETAVVWMDLRTGPEAIMLGRINTDGIKPVEDQRLTSMEFANLLSDVTWTGSEFGMTWQIHTGSEEIGQFQRFDVFGNPLATDVPADGQLAWTGSEFLSVARDGTYSRVAADGQALIIGDSLQIPPDLVEVLSSAGYDAAWGESSVGMVVTGDVYRFMSLRYCQ